MPEQPRYSSRESAKTGAITTPTAPHATARAFYSGDGGSNGDALDLMASMMDKRIKLKEADKARKAKEMEKLQKSYQKQAQEEQAKREKAYLVKRGLEESAWVDDAATRAEMHWLEKMAGADGVSEGHAGDIKKEFQEFAEEYLASAPSDKTKVDLNDKLNRLGVRLFKSALSAEAKAKTVKQEERLGASIDSAWAMHEAGLMNEEETRAEIAERAGTFAGLVEPETIQKQVDSAAVKFSKKTLDSQMATEPQAVRQELNQADGGRFGVVLPSQEDYERFLGNLAVMNPDDVKVQKEIVEGRIPALLEHTKKTGELPTRHFIKWAAYAKGGTTHKGMNAAAYEVANEFLNARRFYAASYQMLQLPSQQWDEFVEAQKVDAVKEDLKLFKNQQDKLLEDDPFRFALQKDSVKTAQAEFIALQQKAQSGDLAAQERLSSARDQFIEAGLLAQHEAGVPEYGTRLLAKEQAATLKNEFENAEPEKLAEIIGGYQAVYGKYFPKVLQEIKGAGLDGSIELGMLLLHEPEFEPFLKALRTADDEWKKEFPDGNTFINAVDDALETDDRLARLYDAVVVTGGGSEKAGRYFTELKQGIRSIALQQRRKGITNPEKAVRKAMEMMERKFSFMESNGASLIVPKEAMDVSSMEGLEPALEKERMRLISQILPTLDESKTGLQLIDEQEVDPNFLGVENVEDAKHLAAVLKRHSFWRTKGDGTGVELMVDNGTAMVNVPNRFGEPIERSFRDLKFQSMEANQNASQIIMTGMIHSF